MSRAGGGDPTEEPAPGRRRHWLEWKRTEVEGRPAFYGEAGSGRPVLFLHGWGLDHRSYKRPLSRLAGAGVRVIAPALPGFGGTVALPRSRTTMAGYGTWVAGFLDALGIDEPVLVAGHSFGGGVAIVVAHDHGDRVRGLVLINSIGGSAWTRDKGVVRSMAERPLWDWGLHLPGDLVPGRQLRRVLPVLLSEAGRNLVRDPAALWRTGRLARSADLTGRLEALRRRRLPVVVLWGTRDQVITRASFETMCEALGAPDVVTVDASHGWLIADPDAFGEVMTNVVKVADLASGARGAGADGVNDLVGP